MSLIPGQTVVVDHGSIFGTVLDFPSEERVRVEWEGGYRAVYFVDEVRTRAGALHHAHRLIVRIAKELGEVGLMDAMEQAAAYVERAAQQAEAADAVRGISPRAEVTR